MRSLITAFTAFILMFTSSAYAERQTPDEVRVFVEKLGEKVIKAINDNSNDFQARQNAFENIFRDNANVPKIARFVAGKAWRSSDDVTKSDYIDAYRSYMAFTYAARINNFDDQMLEVGRVKDIGRAGFLVKTNIISNNSVQPPVVLTWQLSDKDNALKVTDLKVENISMSLTQRSEFSSILAKNNNDLAKLTDILKKRTIRE
ncbi:MAG: ABC transporter substrate-binding protein [Pseudomonadota bacterium]